MFRNIIWSSVDVILAFVIRPGTADRSALKFHFLQLTSKDGKEFNFEIKLQMFKYQNPQSLRYVPTLQNFLISSLFEF